MPADSSVTRLVEGDITFFFVSDNLGFLFKTTDNTVDGVEKILFIYSGMIFSCGSKGCFVAHIGDIGSGETRCLAGKEIDIYAIIHLDRFEVNFKNLFTFVNIREFYMYLAVETAGTHKGFIENFGTVCSGKDDNAGIGPEAIHLGKQLVKSIFSFVVRIKIRILTTSSTYCINLIDKYDTRGFFFCLAEKVAHTRGTDTDKHFHEIGAGHREERHVSLAGYCLGKEGFTRSRRTYQKGALRNFSSKSGIAFRVFKKVYYLFYLLFGTFKTCHIGKSNLIFYRVFVKHLRF